MKIAVLGAGMVGSAIAADLAKKFEVTSIDRSETVLENLHNQHPGISIRQYDLNATGTYAEMLKPFDVVVTAVPGFMGYKILESVIKAGKNVVDISFSPENTLQLDELAKSNNVQ